MTILRHSRALLTLVLLAIPASGHAQFDSWLTDRAKALEPHAPPVEWGLSLGEFDRQYVDEIVMAGAERVLVGIADGPYVMLDAATGDILWKHERERTTEGYRILSTLPVVLLVHHKDDEQRILALDPLKGNQLWKDDGDSSRSFVSSPDGTALLLATPEASALELRFVDVATGDVRWETTALPGTTEIPELLVTDSNVISVGATVSAFSWLDGTLRWRQDSVGPVPPTSYPTVHETGLLVPGPQGRLTEISTDGSIAWRSTLPGAIGAITVGASHLLVHASPGSERQDVITRLSPETGEVVWQSPVGGQLTSNLLVNERSVVYTRFDSEAYVNSLDRLDLLDGGREWSTRLRLCGANRLPDVLVGFPDRVTLAQENLLSAYRLTDGSVLWRHELHWTQTHAWIRYRLEIERGTFERLAAVLRGDDPAAVNRHRFPDTDLDQGAFREFWRNSVAATYRSTSGPLAPGSGSSGWERQYARRDRIMAISGARVSAQVDGAFGRMRAQVDMMFSAIGAMMAAQRAPVEEALRNTGRGIENLRGSLRSALVTHAGLVRGEYYVHPVIHPGRPLGAHDPAERVPWWGFMVVELATGRWSVAITSPAQRIIFPFFELTYDYQRSHANQLATLSPDGTRFVSRGIGIDPDQWDSRKRNGVTVAYPSILSIAFEDLQFHEPAELTSRVGYGFVDTTGEFVVAPIFEELGSHVNGRALVHCTGFRGFVDRQGEYVVPPRYRYVLPYSDSVVTVQRFDGRYEVLDIDGRQIAGGKTFSWMDQFVDGVAAASDSGKRGYVGKDGMWVIEPMYDHARAFSEGLAGVGIDGSWQFIDRTGTVVIAREMEEGGKWSEWLSSSQCSTCLVEGKRWEWPTREGLIVFQDDDRYGFMNRDGEVIIPARYYRAYAFADGLAAVQLVEGSGPNLGFIDRSGAVVIPARFRQATRFSDGRAAVQIDYGRWAIIDRTGAPVLDSLVGARNFSEGLAAVAVDQGKLQREWGVSDPLGGPVWGYVNHEGEFVLRPQFRDAGPFSEGMAWARPLERPLVPTP